MPHQPAQPQPHHLASADCSRSLRYSRSTTDTTAVSFVTIPAKQVLGNAYVGAGKTKDVLVIGGSTTVPTNATTVRLDVFVKGAAAGTLQFYPTGNQAGGAGHTLSWAAGGNNTTVTRENIGLRSKVTVKNTSSKPANVTMKITGYSTQVTAGDINGSGGTNGQVLTNNGTGGATWKTPTQALPEAYGGIKNSLVSLEAGQETTVHTRTVPAGQYLITFTGQLWASGGLIHVSCKIVPPGVAIVVPSGQTSVPGQLRSTVALQGLMSVPAGTIAVRCTSDAFGTMASSQLTALEVGSIN